MNFLNSLHGKHRKGGKGGEGVGVDGSETYGSRGAGKEISRGGGAERQFEILFSNMAPYKSISDFFWGGAPDHFGMHPPFSAPLYGSRGIGLVQVILVLSFFQFYLKLSYV